MNILWNLMPMPIIHFIAMQIHYININNAEIIYVHVNAVNTIASNLLTHFSSLSLALSPSLTCSWIQRFWNIHMLIDFYCSKRDGYVLLTLWLGENLISILTLSASMPVSLLSSSMHNNTGNFRRLKKISY